MHTKSAKKRLRQSLENRAKNRSTKSALKTQVKKVREAVEAGDFAKADVEARAAAEKFDRAAAKNIVHKNMAARTKSRLSALIKGAKQKSKAAPAK
jgi:small subunit ribosomal protein S20